LSRSLLALAAGVMVPLSMAPFHFWLLGPVAVGLLFWVLTDGRSGGLREGWLYGLGLYGVGTSWIYVSIHEHGGASPVLAAVLVALFSAFMAVFPMLLGWAFVRLKPQTDASAAALFAALYVALEWLLTWFLTGFPWVALGYGQIDSPMAGLAPLGGVPLVSFGVLVSGLALALLVRALAREGLEQRRRLSLLLLVVVGPWLLAASLDRIRWTEPGIPRTAALVQGNVNQATKWDPDNRLPIIERYRSLTEPHWGADLILWPEAAITVFEHQAEALLATLDARGREDGSSLVLGLPALRAYPGGEYAFLNSARGLGMAEGRYVKRRLVPFGEYVPLEGVLRGLIQFFDLPMSHAESGDWRQPPLSLAGSPANMAICYEIVYPELVRDPVDVLLTISNDTWFGDSIGPHQHLAIARMRAMENGRWLLRATNNGITAIIDDKGRIQASLPQFESGVLAGEYRIMTGRTPFNRLGSWPLHALIFVLGIALAIRGILRSSAGARFRKAQK
jgi:apolipoprotein N-acyltransferase